jgi:hypothetical protein
MLDAEQHREIPGGDRGHRRLNDWPRATVGPPANEPDKSCDHTTDNTCAADGYTCSHAANGRAPLATDPGGAQT